MGNRSETDGGHKHTDGSTGKRKEREKCEARWMMEASRRDGWRCSEDTTGGERWQRRKEENLWWRETAEGADYEPTKRNKVKQRCKREGARLWEAAGMKKGNKTREERSQDFFPFNIRPQLWTGCDFIPCETRLISAAEEIKH